MFRPTHLVILFAVFMCACAAPAAPATPTNDASAKALEASKLPTSGAEGEGKPSKGDLEADATAYLRFSYGPRWGYYGPDWGARNYGWGFRKSIGFRPYLW